VLIPDVACPGTEVNARCHIFGSDGDRVVVVSGTPVFRYAKGDRLSESLFIAQALEAGFARPCELVPHVGVSVATIHRIRSRYAESGARGLIPSKRGPKGPRLDKRQERRIRRLYDEGVSAREIGRLVNVSRMTVGAALKRMGLPAVHPSRARQGQLPVGPLEAARPVELDPGEDALACEGKAAGAKSEELAEGKEIVDLCRQGSGEGFFSVEPVAEPVADTLDDEPANRQMDRALAAMGEITDCAPLFESGRAVARAGVLLAVPLMVASGIFEVGRQVYGHIGPAFYGLRTTLLTLLVLALERIRHPENMKEYSPRGLGRILGLDRTPEVKTLRRKLARFVLGGKSEEFLSRLVKRRVAVRGEALGYLYVDGHVRVYSGKKVRLPKAHVARMRLSLPATQDVWVNDADGGPLFFVTQAAHPQLVGALRELLQPIRELVGGGRRVTVVFDRGGWSPELFRDMWGLGFDVMTYRKGATEPVATSEFKKHVVPGTAGKQVYLLHDMEVTVLKGEFRMRQVSRLSGDHQTQIMTTRRDLEPVEVAVRMFDRWRQENFFKYMREQYAIDALVEYGAEAADPARLVPNPARKTLAKEIRKIRGEVERLEAALGAAVAENPETKRRTVRGFKIAHAAAIGVPLREARAKLSRLRTEYRQTPDRVPVGQIQSEVLQLPRAKKRLTDGLKMLAYQIETDLARAVAPWYARSQDEIRPLIRAALNSTADLEVTDGELRITIEAQSSPHRTRAIARLCELLTETNTLFPGTSLRLRYAIRGADSIISP